MATTLPSHRQLLSSLIIAVCHPPPQSSSQTPSLKTSIPPSRRQFLLTLHVLFPTLLLPALDLLDRQLITCLVTNHGQGEQSSGERRVYVVRSLATTLKGGARRRAAGKQAPEQGSYVVRLKAWNCTCASFALDAYGAPSRPAPSSAESRSNKIEASLFGGLSLEGADVPCCKHLLACLLADNWESVLGGRIETRLVTRDELAGIMASI